MRSPKTMVMTNPESRYFLWLCNWIRADNHKEFGSLLRRLNSLTFYSLVPHDDNRALDGLNYRETYFRQTGIEPPLGDCTVLEVLIGIAERMSYLLYDPDLENEDQVHIWFWYLIENLGLTPYDTYGNEDKINIWLERKYDSDGTGGLFPLKYSKEDQRKVEIWYQMQAYVNEYLY